MINTKTLEKLDWLLLTRQLINKTQTFEGKERAENILPILSKNAIEAQWELILSLKEAFTHGAAPFAFRTILPVKDTLKRAGIGQLLEQESLLNVRNILRTTKDFSDYARSSDVKTNKTIAYFERKITPLRPLLDLFEQTFDQDAHLLDHASYELKRIRSAKNNIARQIEARIKHLLQKNTSLAKYLQDDYFTKRNDRYVVPIKVDGNGRVDGVVVDTSSSGLTIFVEPSAIRPLNDDLIQLLSEEKIEILKILLDVSKKIAGQAHDLSRNYDSLIELDFIMAHALLAKDWNAEPISIVSEPVLDLKNARHPLLYVGDIPPVANDISLENFQHMLMISGPNAGGKTVLLKTVGIMHLMAKSGFLLPVDPESKIYLFDNIFVEVGDNQDISATLSSFSSHLIGIKKILDKSSDKDLVLIDEIATGTEPEIGSCIGQSILEHLESKKITTIVTTHFDRLKNMAIEQPGIRNGSMEFDIAANKPTFKLLLDGIGLSYGFELAERVGIPDFIISRAKSIMGDKRVALESIIESLRETQKGFQESKEKLDKETLELNIQKRKWEQDVTLIRERQKTFANRFTEDYKQKLLDLEHEFNEKLNELNKEKLTHKELTDIKGNSKQKIDQVLSSARLITEQTKQTSHYKKISIADIQIGDKVFIVSLNREAFVVKTEGKRVEVESGFMRVKVSIDDLRKP